MIVRRTVLTAVVAAGLLATPAAAAPAPEGAVGSCPAAAAFASGADAGTATRALLPPALLSRASVYVPRKVTLWPTSTSSASITWQKPATTKPVKAYEIVVWAAYPPSTTWRKVGDKVFSASLRRVTITGQSRANGVRLKAQVRAKFAAGWGPWSATAYTTVPGTGPTTPPTAPPTAPPTTAPPTPEPPPTTAPPSDPCAQWCDQSSPSYDMMKCTLCQHPVGGVRGTDF